YQSNGSAFASGLINPNTTFMIPPGGSTTVNVHNKGNFGVGYMRVYSSDVVSLSDTYALPPIFPATATVVPVTSRMLSIPGNVGVGSTTGIAIYNATAGQLLLTQRDVLGVPVASRSIDVTAGQHIVGFVTDLLSGLPATVNGKLTIESRATTGTGSISVIALQ